ncbi:DUF2442 domain-containing protein [Paraburkholderia sp. 22098]|uniref:DUF2442 domain-containing protein n=1 Tax=Paraburkholderia sp. 22098 TaxID=3453874 RepID=UPI003F85A7FB
MAGNRCFESLQRHALTTRSWPNLADGRHLSMPLSDFPRLLGATPEQRARMRISAAGLHWDELDEDLSIAALFRAYS